MSLDIVIGFIGGGNLARAIAEGIIKKGLIDCSKIIVSALSEKTLKNWEFLSVQTTLKNLEVIIKADVIFLSFKPYQLDSALKDVKFHQPIKSKLFVSVLAGVSFEVLYDKLIFYHQYIPRLIRVMPNTLSFICEGCSAVAAHSSATSDDIDLVKKIFTALGKCEVVSENLIPAITGLSGSGPAYVYMVIEALSDGGVKQGLPRNLANTFAAQTVFGAAKMVLETKKHTSQLKDEVCSAGGTTIYAVHALEKGCLRATLMNAVEEAAKRAEEIGKK